MVIQAFSLSLESLQWIHTFPRGQRSAAVERAINFYMNNNEVLISRDSLQELVLEYSEQIESLEEQIENLRKNPRRFD